MKRLFVFGMMTMMVLTTAIAKAEVCIDQAVSFAQHQSSNRGGISILGSVRLRPGQDADLGGYEVWNREFHDTVTYVFSISGHPVKFTFNAENCQYMRYQRGGPAGVGTSDGGADW